MSSIQLCAVAMTGICAAVIIKQWRADFLPLIRLGLTVLFAFAIIGSISPLISYVHTLLGQGGIASYAETLFKALGVGILTQCCGDICRESGEAGIGAGVETVGKAEILMLCLPLIREIVEMAGFLLNMGGSA